MNFVYLKVFFAEPKNELNILLSNSFLHYRSQKNKEFLKTFWNLDKKFVIVGVLISNFPPIQFLYKFEFILCKNCGTSYKDINQSSHLLVVHSVVWSFFSWMVLNQRIDFAVLMLKSSFNFVGPTMKSQKWSRSEALESNYTLQDGLEEYYRVCLNKCILKAFKFLANNLDINFTWTHCTLIITF